MSKHLITTVQPEATIAASTVVIVDLPVHPLSHLILHLRGLNVSDQTTLAEMLARISLVEVLFKGNSIVSLRGDDLYALNIQLMRSVPTLTNQVATDNAVRDMAFIIPLSRKLYDGNEAFPATQRGELQFRITSSASAAAIDNLEWGLLAVNMPDASPTQYLKSTTFSLTPTSGADNDIALPVANKYAGIMVFGTTVPTGTAETVTVDGARILKDNVEEQLASSTWETLRGETVRRSGHQQPYDLTIDNAVDDNYVFIDFTPNDDDEFLFETEGASAITFRFTAGDASAMRLILLEIVSV